MDPAFVGLGTAIRALRNAKFLTQEDLAELANNDQSKQMGLKASA